MEDSISQRLEKNGFELAPLGKRSIAYVIDDMLVTLIFIVVLWDQIVASRSVEQTAMLINSVWIWIVMVQILYHTYFVWQYGASLGKIAMKMRVIEAVRLEQPGFMVALNRAVFRVVSGMIFYLGFAWAFFDPMRQALHDKTASTLVVNA